MLYVVSTKLLFSPTLQRISSLVILLICEDLTVPAEFIELDTSTIFPGFLILQYLPAFHSVYVELSELWPMIFKTKLLINCFLTSRDTNLDESKIASNVSSYWWPLWFMYVCSYIFLAYNCTDSLSALLWRDWIFTSSFHLYLCCQLKHTNIVLEL